ncbi:MAG: class I mannose-6-phosphate isomerase [Clostridiaceae bacterium]|jgi:mannose-6-phosphate isomerase|nr:class I mannose-6-phosphate isomerase [Clostridiaceae bacterium]
MLYPLKFKPVYKDYIWGGRNLQKLGKTLPQGIVAESWELSCHPDGMSIVDNGEFRNRTLESLIDEFGPMIMGDSAKAHGNKFPLLVKLIDANSKLSVQVHPDDDFSLANENEYGKNEMWYIIDAKEGATLIYDVIPGMTPERFKKAISENMVEEYLNKLPVKAGDFINIPAGVVHAIGEGIVLAEIQQNSNTTYRLYDYNRRDAKGNLRPLHIEKALKVIDFNTGSRKMRYNGIEYNLSPDGTAKILAANPYYCVELLKISGETQQITFDRHFHIIVCIDGNGEIKWAEKSMPLQKGETALIPSSLGNYSIIGNVKALKAYVPDLERDILNRLMSMGFPKGDIIENISGIAPFV